MLDLAFQGRAAQEIGTRENGVVDVVAGLVNEGRKKRLEAYKDADTVTHVCKVDTWDAADTREYIEEGDDDDVDIRVRVAVERERLLPVCGVVWMGRTVRVLAPVPVRRL